MITEIVRIPVDPARVGEFLRTYEPASAPYYDSPGCLSNRLYWSEEEPGILVGIVEWDSLEAHKEALTSPVGQRLLAAIEPLTTDFPDVKFYQPTSAGAG